jgi:hypothetical protein
MAAALYLRLDHGSGYSSVEAGRAELRRIVDAVDAPVQIALAHAHRRFGAR